VWSKYLCLDSRVPATKSQKSPVGAQATFSAELLGRLWHSVACCLSAAYAQSWDIWCHVNPVHVIGRTMKSSASELSFSYIKWPRRPGHDSCLVEFGSHAFICQLCMHVTRSSRMCDKVSLDLSYDHFACITRWVLSACRGQAAAFATFTNFGSNFLVCNVLLPSQTHLTNLTSAN